MRMRTTLILDDALLAEARELTGIEEKTALVHAALKALIARESARRLAALAGTMPPRAAPPRRRDKPTRRRLSSLPTPRCGSICGVMGIPALSGCSSRRPS